jgi:Lysozyme like domain
MLLDDDAIYELMTAAGFPAAVATTMCAIALRESGGDPTAYNNHPATGDRSYGLLQINCYELGAKVLPLFGIDTESELLDPAKNAHAGFILWGGNNGNLDVAWYIARPGIDRERYEQLLPRAQQAALRAMARTA